MKFTETTRQAEFLKRYKRFFADVRLEDQMLTAHVPNTGSLKTCLFEGAPCIISESNNPERKLKATLQFLKTPTSWVGVNTSLPNALVYEAWEEKIISDWAPFGFAKREHKLNKETRLDMVLSKDPDGWATPNYKALHFIEIKNVTYAVDGVAAFPDAVSTRGQKHLQELMKLKEEGFGAEIVFVVQRQDCEAFRPADEIDPEYGRLLRQAQKKGVVIRALSCEIDPLVGIRLNSKELKGTW